MSGAEDLIAAVEAGDLDAVRALVADHPDLAAARDPDGLSAVRAARYRGAMAIVNVLLAASPPLDIWDAAAVGDAARAAAILDEQPGLVIERSSDGMTPLGLAVFFDHPVTARLLIERGADLHQRAVPFGAPMPLHSAVAGNHPRTVQVLLDHGADPNAVQAAGWRALHSAAQHGNVAIVRSLLAAGADPTLRTDDGRLPADVAGGPDRDGVAALLA